MANFAVKDGNGDIQYLKSGGAGSDGDPMVLERKVVQAAHDSLNANTNLQVGDTDVSTLNPVPTVESRGATALHQYTSSADMSASAANLTAAPATGKYIAVTDLIISASAAMVLTLKEETSGTVVSTLDLAAHSVTVVNLAGRIKLSTANKRLQGQTNTSGSIYITAVWIEV